MLGICSIRGSLLLCMVMKGTRTIAIMTLDTIHGLWCHAASHKHELNGDSNNAHDKEDGKRPRGLKELQAMKES